VLDILITYAYVQHDHVIQQGCTFNKPV